jgi:hypothetical protein
MDDSWDVFSLPATDDQAALDEWWSNMDSANWDNSATVNDWVGATEGSSGWWANLFSPAPGGGSGATSGITGLVKNILGGSPTNAGLLGSLAGLYSYFNPDKSHVGYTGGIPNYTVVREDVPVTYDPNRRAGSSGQRYYSDTHYVKSGDTAALDSAQQQAHQQALSLAVKNITNPAKQHTYAQGGLAQLPRYLNGPTDGMADKVPATIDGHQKAALSHGEFVIPADVVSHLGNGNSNSGAQRLQDMMARIRQARTGSPSQGRQINPNQYLPR